MAYPYDLDYEAAAKERAHKEPKLKTNRSMWKLMILNILTLGIYSILFFIPFSFDIDKVAPRRDGKKTFNYLFAWLLSIFTFQIVIAAWFHIITQRVEDALAENDINYSFGMGDFWGWYVFGSFLCFVGPFVYFHKLCTAMNLLCENFNAKNANKS